MNRVGTSVLALSCMDHPMYSRAEYYRRRGLVAQQEAAQTLDEQIRHIFQEVARGWFELADLNDHLDRGEADERARRR